MSVFDTDNNLIFESMYSKKKTIKEATYEQDGYKVREFQTYSAWKSAVKKLNPNASFTGDKDIDSYKGKDFHAEWDGEKGRIETKIQNLKEAKYQVIKEIDIDYQGVIKIVENEDGIRRYLSRSGGFHDTLGKAVEEDMGQYLATKSAWAEYDGPDVIH